MYKEERFAVICVVFLIILLFICVVYVAKSTSCKAPLKQCINNELYVERENFMVGKGKKCFEKGADNV